MSLEFVQSLVNYATTRDQTYLVPIIFSLLINILSGAALFTKKGKEITENLRDSTRENMIAFILSLSIIIIIGIPTIRDHFKTSGPTTSNYQEAILLGIVSLMHISFAIFVFARWFCAVYSITLVWGGITFACLFHNGFEISKQLLPLIIGYILIIIFCVFQERSLRIYFVRRNVLTENEVSLKKILQQLNEIIIVVNRKFDVQYCNRGENPSALTAELPLETPPKLFVESPPKSPNDNRTSKPPQLYRKKSLNDNFHRSFFERIVKLELHQPALIKETCPAISHKFSSIFDLKSLIELLANDSECFQELFKMKRLSCGGSAYGPRNFTLKEFYEVHISCAVIDQQECFVIIMTNITESIKGLQEKAEMQKNILSSLSHELLTPLNTITNCMDTASKHHGIDQEVKENFILPSIMNCKLLESFVNDVLDFVQIKFGFFSPDMKKGKLLPAVDECIKLYKHSIQKKRLEIQTEFSVKHDIEIGTDFQRLKQILNNLLGNAVKFTSEGAIKLSIEKNSNKLLFTVKDSGIGMTKAELENLMKNLKEASIGKKVGERSTGAGLGLAAANALTQQLNPETRRGLKFKSIKNQETIVTFEIEDLKDQIEEVSEIHSEDIPILSEELSISLPICKPISSTSKRDVSTITFISPPRILHECEKSSILVVDDDGFNIHTIEMILSSFGIKPDAAFNGKAALDLIEKRHRDACCEKSKNYDLIIMDFNMPVMDGLEATRKIRERIVKNEWRSTRIIGCTAFVGEEKKKEGLDSGMDDCIKKPVTKAMIQSLLSSFNTGNSSSEILKPKSCIM